MIVWPFNALPIHFTPSPRYSGSNQDMLPRRPSILTRMPRHLLSCAKILDQNMPQDDRLGYYAKKVIRMKDKELSGLDWEQWTWVEALQLVSHSLVFSAIMSHLEIKSSNPDGYPPPKEDEESLALHVDWKKEEEIKAKRKWVSTHLQSYTDCILIHKLLHRLDRLIMPLLTLGFFCLRKSTVLTTLELVLDWWITELDRGNIANAITDTFMKDVHITQDQFNVGQQMLSLGIVLFEIPSNMILYRVGPGKWLTLQLFLFGTVSTFQAFQHSYSAFIAIRFLLGLTESGFIPGGLWTLSTWYTRKETAKRVMFFYFGNQFGQASAKLLAYGILHMRGVGGKAGWFWLFAIMGAFTIVSGFILGFFLPDSFKNPHSSFLPRVRIFSERELHILRTRVLLDDPMKGKKKKRIGLPAFKKAVSVYQWRRQIFRLLLTHLFSSFSS